MLEPWLSKLSLQQQGEGVVEMKPCATCGAFEPETGTCRKRTANPVCVPQNNMPKHYIWWGTPDGKGCREWEPGEDYSADGDTGDEDA